MTLQITLAGSVIDLDLFEFNVTVAHGRSDVTSSPTASNTQIVLRGDTGPLLELADTVAISFDGVDRFTGAISDLNVSFISTVTPDCDHDYYGDGEPSQTRLYGCRCHRVH